MTPTIVTDDYYAVLGVVMAADAHAIKSAYRRLARVTHPDKNSSPNCKEEFQRLQAAYETLRDPTKRRDYDVTRPKPSTASQPAASTAPGGTPRREYGRATAQTASQEANNTARERALETLQAQRAMQDMDIFEARRNVRKLEAEITKLREEEIDDAHEAANQAGWWENVSSFLFGVSSGKANASREAKEERERRRLNRSAAIRIKSMEKLNKTNRLSTLDMAAQGMATAIEELKQQIRAEEQRQEAERAAEAQRKMWEESMRRMREAEVQRQQQEEQVKRERKEQERMKKEKKEWERKEQEREKREQDEQVRKEQEYDRREQEEWVRKEQERDERAEREYSQWKEDLIRKERERVERQRKEQRKKPAETHKGASKQQHRDSKSANEPQSACLHRGWWTQIPGRAVCSVCSETLVKFALECPGCHMKACASCKRTMQGGKQ